MEASVRRIIDLCNAAGVPRAKMCRDIGIPPTTMSNYCIRGGEPKPAMIDKVARYFGVTPGYIRTGAEPAYRLREDMEELTDKIATLPEKKQSQLVEAFYRMAQMMTDKEQ